MSELAFANGYTGYSNVPAIELAEKLVKPQLLQHGRRLLRQQRLRGQRGRLQAGALPLVPQGQDGQGQDHHAVARPTTAAPSRRPPRPACPPFWRGFGPLDPTFIRAGDQPPLHAPAPPTAPSPSKTRSSAKAPDTVAAVIAEPVQGAGGVIPPGADYFPKLREICDRHNVLLIADEVITGFGRTGRWFALRHWDVQPDIVTFAKAVTSAYIPLSGAIVSQRHPRGASSQPRATRFMHGFTNSAHPTACAVGLRNLQIFDDENLVENAASLGERLHAGLRTLLNEDGVGDVRGLGFIAGVEIVAGQGEAQALPRSSSTSAAASSPPPGSAA